MAYSRMECFGRIAVKDDLRLINEGYVSCVRFRLAVDREYKTREGKIKTDFFNCVAYLKLAEWIANDLKNGDTVFIAGRLKNVNWEEGGRERTRDEIELEKCIFIHGKCVSENKTPAL